MAAEKKPCLICNSTGLLKSDVEGKFIACRACSPPTKGPVEVPAPPLVQPTPLVFWVCKAKGCGQEMNSLVEKCMKCGVARPLDLWRQHMCAPLMIPDSCAKLEELGYHVVQIMPYQYVKSNLSMVLIIGRRVPMESEEIPWVEPDPTQPVPPLPGLEGGCWAKPIEEKS